MDKRIVILISAIAIIVFTAAVSFIGFEIFADKKEQIIGKIEVSLKDNGKGIKLEQLFPFLDREAEKLEPYEFEVSNNGDIAANYKVVIKDIKKGSEKKLLKRSQLRYELSLNGIVIEKQSMSKIKDNILDARSIPKNKTYKYELKVWVPQSAEKTDWMNKYYHYKVDIKPIVEEIR